MFNYYVDGQPVEGPLNLDGLTLRKGRSLTYWGFLYRKLGYVEGLSNVEFREAQTVSYLRQVFARDGVQGSTTFAITSNGAPLYNGYIDYSTYTYDGNGVSVGFRDERAVVDLENGATTDFGLAPTQTIALPSRRLGGLSQLVTDPATLTIQQSAASAGPITHTVPLTRKSETDDTVQGTLAPVVHPLASDPIYHNTTGNEQIISLSGLVSVTVSASVNLTATLRAVVFGNEGEAVEVAIVAVTTAATLKRVLVTARLRVPAGGSLRLQWLGSGNAGSWAFVYNADTGLSLSDEHYPVSTGYGLSAGEIFTQLVSRSTGGKLGFQSRFLSDNPVFLANGAGIRGLVRPVSLNLQSVFINLNKLFNLALWVDEQKTVRLEEKARAPRRVTTLAELIRYSETPATGYLYSSVQGGYTTWKADSALSNDEPNGQRSYKSALTTLRSELDLRTDFVAASSLIEQQRRKQFDPKIGEAKADALDESLFVVCAVPATITDYRAETLENTASVSGVSEPETLTNLRISPRRNLERWATWLAGSLPLSQQTTQGNDGMESSYDGRLLAENDNLAEPRSAVPMLVTIETPMTLPDYENLGEVIAYPYEGKLREAELLEVVWQKTKSGQSATLTLLQR